MEKLLRTGSYYYVEKSTTCNTGEVIVEVIARYCKTVERAFHPSFWVDFVNLEGCYIFILAKGQADLGKKVVPVSKAFNKYLKLFGK